MSFTLTAYATALFSSWYFIDEHSLLFDAGDGLTAGLMQKAGKIKHVFLSHADRDHITGLLQFLQLNAREDFPKIYYPAGSRSFPSLKAFAAQFDPHVAPVSWTAVAPGDEIYIAKDLVMTMLPNNHLRGTNGATKSLSLILQQVKHKLRAEYAGLPGKDIAVLRKEKGDEAIMMEVKENILAYSGDSPVEYDGRWNDVQTLIHEATFLVHAHNDPHQDRYNKHSTLPDVIAMLAQSNIRQLVLGHFSVRYTHEEIITAVREQCSLHNISFPVYCILPGEVARDVLKQPPVYAS